MDNTNNNIPEENVGSNANAPKAPSASNTPMPPKSPMPPKAPTSPKTSVPPKAPGAVPPRPAGPKVGAPIAPRRVSMNKEEQLQGMNRPVSKQNKFNESHKNLLKKQNEINARIYKKRKKIKKSIMFQANGNLTASHNAIQVLSPKYYGGPFAETKKARALAVLANKKAFAKGKHKKNRWLVVALVVLLFLALIGGSYYAINNFVDKDSITNEDIIITEKPFGADSYNFFSQPVSDYLVGDSIKRGISINNKSNGVDVFLAFKMSVVEIFPNEPGRAKQEIDLVATPTLLGTVTSGENTNLWTSYKIGGENYYYYNSYLKSNSTVTLFKEYTVTIVEGSPLQEEDLPQRTIEVTVTVEVLQGGLGSLSSSDKDVWKYAPATWQNNF